MEQMENIIAKDQQEQEDGELPFSFLRHIDAVSLFNYIQQEHPQIIALILSYLEPEKTAVIFKNLPQVVQSDLARRIASMDRVNTEVLKKVEHALEKKLSALGSDDYKEIGDVESSEPIPEEMSKKKKSDNSRIEVLSKNEIDQLLTAIKSGDVKPKVLKPDNDNRKIKFYDFKRPDKFSKENIRTVSIIHESFAQFTATNLSEQLRSMVNVNVAAVDQLTYEEFIRSIPTTTTLAIINMDPLIGNALFEIDPITTFSIIDRLLGGAGEVTNTQYKLTDMESAVMEEIIMQIMGNLREAWTNIIDLRPQLVHIETNPQFAQIAPLPDMVLLVTLETKVRDVEGIMNLCIPYRTIEPIIGKLTENRHETEGNKMEKSKTDSLETTAKAEAKITISVELGITSKTIKEVREIGEGTIVELNKLAGEPVDVKANDVYYAKGEVIVIDEKFGVLITELCDKSHN